MILHYEKKERCCKPLVLVMRPTISPQDVRWKPLAPCNPWQPQRPKL